MATNLTVDERRYLRDLLLRSSRRRPHAIVLVGSRARKNSFAPSSDIDIVALNPAVPPEHVPPRVQLIQLSEDQLRRRVADGDDFAQWALRFGKPLSGVAYWDALRNELLPHAPWPDYRTKLRLGRRRLSLAMDLLAMGDLDAALEELRFALSHAARARMLASGVFPLSRRELADQVRDSDAELADGLLLVDRDQLDEMEIRRLVDIAKPRLMSVPPTREAPFVRTE